MRQVSISRSFLYKSGGELLHRTCLNCTTTSTDSKLATGELHLGIIERRGLSADQEGLLLAPREQIYTGSEHKANQKPSPAPRVRPVREERH